MPMLLPDKIEAIRHILLYLLLMCSWQTELVYILCFSTMLFYITTLIQSPQTAQRPSNTGPVIQNTDETIVVELLYRPKTKCVTVKLFVLYWIFVLGPVTPVSCNRYTAITLVLVAVDQCNYPSTLDSNTMPHCCSRGFHHTIAVPHGQACYKLLIHNFTALNSL